jgi:CBS domain containing-hemolysin-like protein
LPLLLLASGFFSGSETALFALTENERMSLRRGEGLAARAVELLLTDQRMLLITILVGNMTINVLYFVVTSVLLMKSGLNLLGEVLLGAAFLVVIILLGEVTPKLIANTRRVGFASFVAPLLLTLHRVIAPVRVVLDRFVVAPLSRLTSPSKRPPRLDEEELSALLEVSGSGGVIDEEEQRILQDVISLSQLKVRDVMTPRVRVAAISIDASYEQVRDLAEQTRLTKFPVYRENIDQIVGLLPVRTCLLDPPGSDVESLQPLLTPAHYVPETARLDQLLNRFRETHTQLAIVVDEYGGTAGVVAAEDVVEELVGDIASDEQRGGLQPPKLLGPGRWRVDGASGIHDWAEAFGTRLVSPQVATLGGFIVARLGRAPQVGDRVELGNVRLQVEQIDRARVLSIIVTLLAGEAGQEGAT